MLRIASAARDGAAGSLTFSASILNSTFTAANSVVNGINKIPNQTTGGEGPKTVAEALINVTFTPPVDLPADHYFFRPEVLLDNGNFLWLSAPRPIVGGTGPFVGICRAGPATMDLRMVRRCPARVAAVPEPAQSPVARDHPARAGRLRPEETVKHERRFPTAPGP